MESWGKYATTLEGEFYVWGAPDFDATQPGAWPTDFDRPVRRLSSPRDAVLGRAMARFLDGTPALNAAHVRNRMKALTLPRIRALDLRDTPLAFNQDPLTRAIVRAARKTSLDGVVLRSPGGVGETVAVWTPLDRRRHRSPRADPPPKPVSPDSLLLQAARLSSETERYAGRLSERIAGSEAGLLQACRADLAAVEWLYRDATEASQLSPAPFVFIRQVLAQLEIEHAAMALRSGDLSLRMDIAEQLPARRRRTAVPALIDLSHDEDWLTRQASARAIASLRHPLARRRVRELFEQEEQPVVRRAILVEPGSMLTREPGLLRAAAKDEDPLIRAAAVEVIVKEEGKLAPDSEVAAGIHDQEPIVRSTTLGALDFRDPDAHGHFKRALDDPAGIVRQVAVRQIHKARPEWSLDAFRAVRDDSEPAVREQVALGLNGVGGPEAARSLLFMLAHDGSEQVRQRASKCLAGICHPDAVRAMIDLVAAGDPLAGEIRASFHRRSGERALAAAKALLESPPFKERGVMLRRSVGGAPADEVFDLLLAATDRGELQPQESASLIAKIRDLPAQRLVEAAMSDSVPVRTAAILASPNSTASVREQVPVLLYATTSYDERIRTAAWTAMSSRKGRAGRLWTLRRVARGKSHLAELAARAAARMAEGVTA